MHAPIRVVKNRVQIVATLCCSLLGCAGESSPQPNADKQRDGRATDTRLDVSAPPAPSSAAGSEERVPGATATLESRSGSSAGGQLALTQEEAGVRIRGAVNGLKGGANHGFHVHETGDCSAPDARSAGQHFNPMNQPHGHPSGARRHAGDLFNLSADASGIATVDLVATDLTIAPGERSVVGRALVVHAAEDDYSSQPAGDSGEPIACGVVE